MLGFKHIKKFYENNDYFESIFLDCEKTGFEKFFKHDGFFFKENKLYVLKDSLRESLLCEAH